jgi:hypothetical protein
LPYHSVAAKVLVVYNDITETNVHEKYGHACVHKNIDDTMSNNVVNDILLEGIDSAQDADEK